MNVYFVARNYIKEDAFEYLIKVLKAYAVFSFIDVDEMSDSLKKQLGTKLVQYKRYLKRGGDVNDFINKCVTYITGLAVRTHLVDGRFEQVDMDSFQDSRFNNPIRNLQTTDDKNVFILCDMYEKELSDYMTIPIFHDVIREKKYESKKGYDSIYYIDASHELTNYVYYRLRKMTGSDKYRDRICFYRFGKDKEELFFRYKWGVPVTKTNDNKEIRRRFYKYILKELNLSYPEVFPIIQEEDKKYLTSFYNRKRIRQVVECYRPEPEIDYNPYWGYGSFEEMTLLEAYDGDPSLMWNND